MAITKKFVINRRLDDRVGYVLNDEKTSLDGMLEYAINDDKTVTLSKEYKTALNCKLKTAYKDMMDTKKRKNATGGRLGYHIIQSFKPGEITAEEAHEIAIEFAKQSFNDYEVVIGTHIDKEHVHSHIIVNSVSYLTGKKYRDSASDLYDGIRETSDKICREHGLSVIITEKEKRTLTYSEWLARNNKGTSWQSLIRLDIDDCIQQAFDFGNFLVLMKLKGYEIKQGKYIAFRPIGKDRFSRGYKLGHTYSMENIKRRIAGVRTTTEFKDMQTYVKAKYNFKPYPKAEKGSIKALSLYYMYLMGQAKKNSLPDRVNNIVKEDLVRFETIMKTISFIKSQNFDTVESVQRYKDKCYETISLIKGKRAQLKEKNKDYSKLFKELIIRNRCKQAYELYANNGFKSMKSEHDSYLKAVKALEESGYSSEENIQQLISIQSEADLMMSGFTSDIRHFKGEIKKCNKALELNGYMNNKKTLIEQEQQMEGRQIDEPRR